MNEHHTLVNQKRNCLSTWNTRFVFFLYADSMSIFQSEPDSIVALYSFIYFEQRIFDSPFYANETQIFFIGCLNSFFAHEIVTTDGCF